MEDIRNQSRVNAYIDVNGNIKDNKNDVDLAIFLPKMKKYDVDLAIFLPKMKKYDGIKILEESPFLLRIPSEESVEISTVLYAATGNEKYLDIIKKNIGAFPNNICYVAMLSYCKPYEKIYKMFKDIYINKKNKVNRNLVLCKDLVQNKMKSSVS